MVRVASISLGINLFWVTAAAAGFGALSVMCVFCSAVIGYKIADEVGREAKIKIVSFEARTAEAELKSEQLRKELGPRHLQRDIFLKEIVEAPPSRVEIMYLRDDPECFNLAQQIWRVLEDAKWEVMPPVPIPDPAKAFDMPTAMTVDGQPSGVTVVIRAVSKAEAEASMKAMLGEPWVRTPWTVLTHALGDSLGRIGSSAGGPNAPPDGTLRIVVAPR